jgi:hypothetical protein
MAIWRIRIAWWITTTTNTHSEYVILIAFPLPKWQHEHASMSRHTYTAGLVLLRLLQCSGSMSGKKLPFNTRCRFGVGNADSNGVDRRLCADIQ